MTGATAVQLTRWAPVLAAFVTTASMIFAVTTYWRGAREQKQASAINILQDYLKFSVDHPELASRDANAPTDARYEWFAAHTLFTAESLWTFVGDDERWDKTLDVLLRPHRAYLQEGAVRCEAFQPGFLQYLKSRFPNLNCAK
jgi:hypothetical protein